MKSYRWKRGGIVRNMGRKKEYIERILIRISLGNNS